MRTSARRRLGTGAHLLVGLGMVGAAGYVFVAIVGYVFTGPRSAAEVGALTSLYLLINIIGPGLFAALEPETSRAVSASIARDQPVFPVVRRSGALALRVFAGLAVLVVVLSPVLLGRVFADRPALLAALIVAAAGSAAVYWVRGILSGQQRLRSYALTLYLEGIVRLVPCLILFAFAVREPAAYGLVFAAGAGIAAVVLVPGLRVVPNRDQNDQVAGMGRSLSFVVSATLLTQLVTNLAPVVVTYRMPDDLVVASAFAVSFVFARIPLMLFAPVQAVLLPYLTRAVDAREFQAVRARIRQALLAVIALGIVGTAFGALAGPSAVELLFNTSEPPSGWVFGLLGVATILTMMALVLQPALLALRCQRAVSVGWVAGAVLFLAVLFVPVEPIAAALAAQVLGPATVLLVTGTKLWQVLRAAQPRSANTTSSRIL